MTRKTWDLQLDIMAPQIFVVEKFDDNNSAMAVIDFGRLQLSNMTQEKLLVEQELISKNGEDDGKYL